MIRLLPLTLLLACSSAPHGDPGPHQLPEPRQLAFWTHRQRRALPPKAVVGLWGIPDNAGRHVDAIEFRPDGTYRRGDEFALFPDDNTQATYEAGAYLVFPDTLLFNPQADADHFPRDTPQDPHTYNTVYEHPYHLDPHGHLVLGLQRPPTIPPSFPPPPPIFSSFLSAEPRGTYHPFEPPP